MFDVEIKHEIDKNYLIIHGKEENTYMLKMLTNNTIKGFLELEVRVLDNKNLYYYDITGKETISQRSARKKWSLEEIKRTIADVLGCLEKSKEYFLTPEHFVLNPEYMYCDRETGETCLCYAWNYEMDINGQLTEIFSYFMSVVDYEDKEAVDLVYRLYDVSREQHCTLQNLWGVLSGPKVKHMVITESENGEVLEQKNCEIAGKLKEITLQKKKGTEKKSLQALGKNKKSVSSKEKQKKEGDTCRTQVPMAGKIIGIIGLQVAVLLVIFFAAKSGFFFESGMINYTKCGATFLVLGVLDLYGLTKIFSSFEENEPGIKMEKVPEKNQEKIIEQKKNTIVEQSVPDEEKRQEKKRSPQSSCFTYKGYQALERQQKSEPDLPLDSTTVLDFGKTVIDVRANNVLAAEKQHTCYLVPEEEGKEVISLGKFPFFIGRFQKDTNSFRESKNISRMHSKIEQIGSRFFITDLDSTNGTFVNEKRLEKDKKTELYEGDQVMFANIPFHFTMKLRG